MSTPVKRPRALDQTRLPYAPVQNPAAPWKKTNCQGSRLQPDSHSEQLGAEVPVVNGSTIAIHRENPEIQSLYISRMQRKMNAFPISWSSLLQACTLYKPCFLIS
eukprot:1162098-Pelagomonas_calceolata.AAC.4